MVSTFSTTSTAVQMNGYKLSLKVLLHVDGLVDEMDGYLNVKSLVAPNRQLKLSLGMFG